MSLTYVELVRFCEKHKMALTTFGRKCGSDSNLIQRIGEGRKIGQAVETRVRLFMAQIEAGGAPNRDRKKRSTAAVRKVNKGRPPNREFYQAANQGRGERGGPCFKCGVRFEVHADMGCNRWRQAS